MKLKSEKYSINIFYLGGSPAGHIQIPEQSRSTRRRAWRGERWGVHWFRPSDGVKTQRSRVWAVHLMTAVWWKLVRPSLHRSFTTCATPGGHAATSSTRQALPTTCNAWKIRKCVMELCNLMKQKLVSIEIKSYWTGSNIAILNYIIENRNPDAKTVYIQNMSSLLSNERWFDIDWVRSRDTGSSLMLLQGACIALKIGKKMLLRVFFFLSFFTK